MRLFNLFSLEFRYINTYLDVYEDTCVLINSKLHNFSDF